MSARSIVVGTAGHIDHGKSALVRTLTGVEPDRLAEERRRGMSIELGYARRVIEDLEVSFVDVPGHERFVRTMVAGATGIDAALLVIAADDGIMPQTREHLDILHHLGIARGFVVLSKIDLVDRSRLHSLTASVADLVSGTFLEGRPVLLFSATTGEGKTELEWSLRQLGTADEKLSQALPFRLPIDRVFSRHGHGTVVTGTMLQGEVRVGDRLELLPGERTVRVRSLQHHGEAIESAAGRQRLAMNLAGVSTDDVRRGDELVTPGVHRSTRRLAVSVTVSRDLPFALENRREWMLHLGTREVPVRMSYPERSPLEAENQTVAVLRSEAEIVAAYGQRCLLRRPSPPLTVAGGIVLDAHLPDEVRLRGLSAHLDGWSSENPTRRVSAWLSTIDALPKSPGEAFRRVGVNESEWNLSVEQLRQRGEVIDVASGLRVHQTRLRTVEHAIRSTIRSRTEQSTGRTTIPEAELVSSLKHLGSRVRLTAIVQHLVRCGTLIRRGTAIGVPDGLTVLSEVEQEAFDKLDHLLEEHGLKVPSREELPTRLDLPSRLVDRLIGIGIDRGVWVEVSERFVMTQSCLNDAERLLRESLTQHGSASLSELRQMWGLTRKWAVPLAEWFDRAGITRRERDRRVLRT